LRPKKGRPLSTETPGRLRARLSGAGMAIQLFPDYLRATWKSIGSGDTCDRLEGYCMFIGYSRSGHTLVGSLLDAHPEMVIAHELDALKYIMAGFGRRTIFSRGISESASGMPGCSS